MAKGTVEESLKLSIFKLKEFGVLKCDYFFTVLLLYLTI